MMRSIMIVAAGGALGTVLRYLGQRFMTLHYPAAFPWGTLAVNLSGCFLIGIFWGMSIRMSAMTSDWKLFLMTGICGGFTTFSAFTLEGINLLKDERVGLFLSYAAASVILGLLATWVGVKVGG